MASTFTRFTFLANESYIDPTQDFEIQTFIGISDTKTSELDKIAQQTGISAAAFLIARQNFRPPTDFRLKS